MMKTKDVEDLYDDIIAGNTDLDGLKVWLAEWSYKILKMLKEHDEAHNDNPVPGHRD